MKRQLPRNPEKSVKKSSVSRRSAKAATDEPASKQSVSESELPASFTTDLNGIPLEMILVPAGVFWMGSTEAEVQKALDAAQKKVSSARWSWYAGEIPRHEVRISSFYLGKFTITQEQWRAVMGAKITPRFTGDNLPMEYMSWRDIQKFCKTMLALTGKNFRLPTEAEWEYACRAGTTGDYAGNLEEMGWHDDNSGQQIQPVGQLKPNAFGLYDMHGNVWEWCEDWYGDYPDTEQIDPRGPETGKMRVLRGGSYYGHHISCRSANRGRNQPGVCNSLNGFRLALGTDSKIG